MSTNNVKEGGSIVNQTETKQGRELDSSQALFSKSDYSETKVTIEIDKDVFDLARCMCFLKPIVSPQKLLENVVRKGIVDVCHPYSKDLKSTFKRNPLDKIEKYLLKGGD